MLMTVSTRDIALQFARSETTIIIGKSSYRLDLVKKGRVVMGATLQLRLLRGYRTVVVPETHFQFNAIVQNQLPRSSRNIRAKFTAESVLLAWSRRHRPKLSCPARSQTSILGILTCEIIVASVTDSVDRHETAVETAKRPWWQQLRDFASSRFSIVNVRHTRKFPLLQRLADVRHYGKTE